MYEIEQEVEGLKHPLFGKRRKIGEIHARARVLRVYPGTLRSIAYEIETNGGATYEFDFVDAGGQRYKIEVSAMAPEII
ncbi:MAG: hypothetical protein M3329_09995 [Pseudomonadota bacterium]|nr:hypothetical protein [Pseudomonadota bacterium]